MRYKLGHREESRGRILAAAGRGFRKLGYEGIGVDGLAKEAGVTSGAFYGHFPSKADAFKEAVVIGMQELREAVSDLQATQGAAWIEIFIDFYLGYKRTCGLEDACALQALTPEVVRADEEVRDAYSQELVRVIEAVAKGLPQATAAERRSRAWALMVMLSGAVTTTRALDDAALAAGAAKAVRAAAILIAAS
jgi:TetR/AcrR family transcriptional regulator, transcriptional repressor for nem operon